MIPTYDPHDYDSYVVKGNPSPPRRSEPFPRHRFPAMDKHNALYPDPLHLEYLINHRGAKREHYVEVDGKLYHISVAPAEAHQDGPRLNTCGKCGGLGHNARTCTGTILPEDLMKCVRGGRNRPCTYGRCGYARYWKIKEASICQYSRERVKR